MSFLRKQEFRTNRNYWTPTFEEVTEWELLEVHLILFIQTCDFYFFLDFFPGEQ
jgi:hypothetical protein